MARALQLHKLDQESETRRQTDRLGRSPPARREPAAGKKMAMPSRTEIVVLVRHQNQRLQQEKARKQRAYRNGFGT
jgi:hypothetical protein